MCLSLSPTKCCAVWFWVRTGAGWAEGSLQAPPSPLGLAPWKRPESSPVPSSDKSEELHASRELHLLGPTRVFVYRVKVKELKGEGKFMFQERKIKVLENKLLTEVMINIYLFIQLRKPSGETNTTVFCRIPSQTIKTNLHHTKLLKFLNPQMTHLVFSNQREPYLNAYHVRKCENNNANCIMDFLKL